MSPATAPAAIPPIPSGIHGAVASISIKVEAECFGVAGLMLVEVSCIARWRFRLMLRVTVTLVGGQVRLGVKHPGGRISTVLVFSAVTLALWSARRSKSMLLS